MTLMNEKWSIVQIDPNSECGYHSITKDGWSAGMIDVWFGTHQGYKTSEEALRAAKLIEKAPEMLELILDLAEALEFQLAKTGYCGPGDHKDKKSDNDTNGGHYLLQQARNLIKEI